MGTNVQTILTLLIVALAAFQVVRGLFRMVTMKKSCGGCGSCSRPVPEEKEDKRRISLM